MGAVELPVTLQVQTKHTLLRPKLFVVNVLTVALYQYVNCVQEKMWWFPFESFADWNEDPDFCVRTAEVKPDRGSFGEAFSRPDRINLYQLALSDLNLCVHNFIFHCVMTCSLEAVKEPFGPIWWRQ